MPLSDLGTLTDRSRERYATPKGQIPTKLDRAIEKKAAKRDDEAKLAAWALKVKDFDHWKDRKTGKRLKRTRALDPLRAEAHHLEPRANEATRYDVRNGIALAFETHEAVERGKLRIVGTVFFSIAGKRYINGRHKVIFEAVP